MPANNELINCAKFWALLEYCAYVQLLEKGSKKMVAQDKIKWAAAEHRRREKSKSNHCIVIFPLLAISEKDIS